MKDPGRGHTPASLFFAALVLRRKMRKHPVKLPNIAVSLEEESRGEETLEDSQNPLIRALSKRNSSHSRLNFVFVW